MVENINLYIQKSQQTQQDKHKEPFLHIHHSQATKGQRENLEYSQRKVIGYIWEMTIQVMVDLSPEKSGYWNIFYIQ